MPQERLADPSRFDLFPEASEVKMVFLVHKEAVPVSDREQSLRPQRVVKVALQQVRQPRQRPFRQGRADVEAACLGAPPQLRLHQPQRWQRRRRSGRVAPKQATGRSETSESADIELRQDDGQDLGGHDGQELG